MERARILLSQLETLLEELPRRDLPAVLHALVALQGRISEGIERLLTPEEAAAMTGWRPGTETGISPRWIYDNWRRLPEGVARKISYRKLRLPERAWRRWLQSGEPIR